MVPSRNGGTLTNVLPHRNAMPQTQDIDTHTVTVNRHNIMANLSLCYPLMMWNVTLEYTTTNFNILGQTRSKYASFPHTPGNTHLYDAVMVVVSQKLGRKCTVPTRS